MSLALLLALKQKFGETRKWPLGLLKVALLTAISSKPAEKRKNRFDCHGNCCVHQS